MQTDDDVSIRVVAAQLADAPGQRVGRKHAGTGFVGQESVVLERHLQGSQHIDRLRRGGQQQRLLCCCHSGVGSEGNHSGTQDVVAGVCESCTVLIDAVIVSKVEVSHAVGLQHFETRWLSTKHVALVNRCALPGSRAFKIANHQLAAPEDGVNRWGEQIVVAVALHHAAHSTVEEHVAREGDDEGLRIEV